MPAPRRARSRSTCESRFTDAAPSSSRTCGREGFHPSRLPPRCRTRAELLLEHGLVDRAIPRQPGRLELHADEGARRLRGQQQSQSARVGARGDERELACEFLRHCRRGGRGRCGGPARRRCIDGRRVTPACRVDGSFGAVGHAEPVEVVEVEERAVRTGRTRRPGPAPLRPQPRPGRAAATTVAGGRRTRARPPSRSTGRGSPRTAVGRGSVRRAPRPRAVAGTTVGSRPTPIADARAPRARGPMSARASRATTAIGSVPATGSTRTMRSPSPAPTTICTRPFSRAPTTVSAGTVTMDPWMTG